LFLGGPYAILLFRGLNLRLKLFFVAIAELFVLCMLAAVDYFFNSEALLGFLYGYSIIVWKDHFGASYIDFDKLDNC
jgi:hypothetical protein